MTRDTETFVASFKKAICDEIEIASHGLNKYLVHVPFTFDDGDHYVVALTNEGDRWVLTDDGNTFMHLAYKLPQFDEGKRWDIIQEVLRSHRIENAQGELRLAIDLKEPPGDTLFSFVRAITKITDVSFLTREVVRSTFWEDFQALTKQIAVEKGVDFNYYHPTRDGNHLYPVSARIKVETKPQVLLFAMATEEQCQRATISLYRWEQWKESFHSIGIFRDQTSIPNSDLARFTDIVDKSFSTLETARERLPGILTGFLG